jgi:hypothetical protein
MLTAAIIYSIYTYLMVRFGKKAIDKQAATKDNISDVGTSSI